MSLKNAVGKTRCDDVMEIGTSEELVYLSVIPKPSTGLGHTITISINHRPIIVGAKEVKDYNIGPEGKINLVSSIVDVRKAVEFEFEVQIILRTQKAVIFSHTCKGNNPDHSFEEVKTVLTR